MLNPFSTAVPDPAVQAAPEPSDDQPTAVPTAVPSDDQDDQAAPEPAQAEPSDDQDQPSDDQAAQAEDPSPEPTPARTSPRAGRKLMDPERVAALRRSYAWARELAQAATTPEEWETVRDTERRLAAEYGVSADTVHRVALGLSYPDAGGPIDLARRAQHDRYQMEREYLGEKAARARMMEPAASLPAPLAVTVTRPDGTTETLVYPAGTTVAVGSLTPAAQDDQAEPSDDQGTD